MENMTINPFNKLLYSMVWNDVENPAEACYLKGQIDFARKMQIIDSEEKEQIEQVLLLRFGYDLQYCGCVYRSYTDENKDEWEEEVGAYIVQDGEGCYYYALDIRDVESQCIEIDSYSEILADVFMICTKEDLEGYKFFHKYSNQVMDIEELNNQEE